MDKFRIEFVVKASEDPKTNNICITSIMNAGRIFLIPEPLQPVRLHDEVIKTKIYQKVKATLQKRHDKRQVWIAMTQDLYNTYVDEEGNMQFKGYLLEEIAVETPQTSSFEVETLKTFIEKFTDVKKEYNPNNLTNLSEKLVLEKFTAKMSNVSQWINNFESECNRLGIEEDTKKIEVLRLYLDESCIDWYSSMLIKHTISSGWSIWKKALCETYADKSWSPIRYAILFKYKQGSLLEYALKKEKLLLEINRLMDKSTLIDLIATGLPNFIADKIDRSNLKETEDLFKNIRGLEHLIKKQIVGKTMVGLENKNKERNAIRPCRICEKQNKGNRYHPESVCWFKDRENNQKKEQIRSVNNSELEIQLNEIDPKN